MNRDDYIEDRTKIAVNAIANKLAPTCLGCPFAKVFISEDRDFETNSHRLRLNFRCDKMGEARITCPDDGNPIQKYAKDIGIMRTLSEKQMAFNINLDYRIMGGISTANLSRLLKSDEYMSMIGSKINAEKHDTEEVLHIWNEAISFVTQERLTEVEPILWFGEKGHENFPEARQEVELDHIMEYKMKVEDSTGICEPTTYMKKHLAFEFRRPFGIFVDHDSKKVRPIHEGVDFLGDSATPPPPEIFIPEPTHDEIYEDWGAFG